ncbi:MAG: citrate synthase [Kribbellaceae bacterium]|nr:citrate synthase [Kribbellaceae bacterium]
MARSSDENYLTTAEVAERLGVKAETIYAYVSRGLLTSVRARGSRGSLFQAGQVERLAERSVEHAGVVERIQTQLSLLTDDELYYRGKLVRELAATRTVESVAQFLWTGELSDQPPFPAPADLVELARSAIAIAPASARLTDHLRIAVAVLGAADPLRFDLAPESVVRAAGQLIGVLVDALPNADGSTVSGNTAGSAKGTLGARIWPKVSQRPPQPELLEATLILLADHGLAVSTVAARVAASARANLYAVVSAGLGALDGHYHGAASTLAYRFVAEALEDPVGALSDRLRAGDRIPGFGHRVYQGRDPRAETLFDLLRDEPVMQVVDAITAELAGRQFPNLDLAVAALMHAHDLRPDAGEALFALARTIGWTAHALEEYAEPGLRFRALGVYTGESPGPLVV